MKVIGEPSFAGLTLKTAVDFIQFASIFGHVTHIWKCTFCLYVVAFVQGGLYQMLQPSFARQRLAKSHCHANRDSAKVSVDTRNLGITRRFRCSGYRRPIDELFGVVASIRSSQAYKREFILELNSFIRKSRVEAGSNTSTITLRVVGGDEKGSLESDTIKYGREIQGTRTRERLRWRGPAAYTKDRPVLSSERAPHKKKTVTFKQK
jgi:hypothetical protein